MALSIAPFAERPVISAGASAPTYFGSASTPADAGANNATPTTVTPPASMLAGDLAIVVVQVRVVAAPTFGVAVTGGQTWNTVGPYSTASNFNSLFWCTYNGTWSASPQFSFTGPNPATAVMQVFRPPSTSNVWTVDVALASTAFALPGSPFTVTQTGLTTGHDTVATLAMWHSTTGQTTYGSLTGTGWIVSGGAQYRNTSGADLSSSYAHHLDATSGATVPSVSKNQATIQSAGITAIMAWYAA